MEITYLKYPVYFLSGSLLITTITLIAEKKSQKVAGIIMCLPVITFLSLFFLGFSHGTEFASRAAVWNPIGAIADLVYLGLFAMGISIPGYTAIIKNGSSGMNNIIELMCGLLFGFTGYFISILTLSGFAVNSGWISLLLLWTVAIIFHVVFKRLKEKNINKPKIASAGDLVLRGFFGDSAVTVVVILGDSFGYMWGGLFTSFPATITPVLILLHMRNGKDMISGVIKSSPTGLSATGLYSCMVWLLYPAYGIITGTLASYLAVFVFLSILSLYNSNSYKGDITMLSRQIRRNL